MGSASTGAGRTRRLAWAGKCAINLFPMSKPLRLASLLVICGLCAAVVVQSRTIYLVREEVRHAMQATEAAQASEQIEKAKVERLSERNVAYEVEAKALRQKLAGPPTAPEAAAAVSPAAPGAPAAPGQTASADFGKALGKMFTDPEMKKMMRQQQGMAVRMMYGDLARELNLSPQEADQVMSLLADRQMEMSERGMAALNGGKDGQPAEEAGKGIVELKSKYDAQLQTLLGDRYPGFQEFDKTIGDRAILQQYQQQFAGSGQPLSDEQRAGLLRIMSEERAAMPPNEFSRGEADPAAQLKALSSDEKVHDLFAAQEELNRRVMARAGTVLNAEQLASFTDMQARMLQMQQMGIKMSRNMFGGAPK